MRIKQLAVNLITFILFITSTQTIASDQDAKTIKAVYLPMTQYYKAFNNSEIKTCQPEITVDKADNWQQVQKLITAGKVDVVFIASPIVFDMLLKKQDFRYSKGSLPTSNTKPLANSSPKEQISPALAKIIESRLKILKKYAAEPIIINAVKKQNSKMTSLKEITAIDKKWIEGSNNDFIKTVLNNNISKYLSKKVKSNKLLYTEAFLYDNQGAIVGAYPRTSDYWQGDETKFTECFNNSKKYIGPLEFDQSTQSPAIQMSLPVKDQGKTIGVLVMGLRNIK